ncbi:MAG: protein kinase [Planctomycetaceae bacterium]|jgi:serine/threonine protein kinase|nr:protein kinase [Planctomycetaceae bacterium]
MKILIDEYQLRRQIYGGLGGRLWVGEDLLNRRKVLIRLLPKAIRRDAGSIERLQSQFNKMKPILQELDINNLIFPERFCENAGSDPFLVSRFVSGEFIGGYASKWVEAEGCFPLYLVPKIFEPVAWMLDVLRQKNFVHRFLTPDSIVINQTEGVILSDIELTGIIREQAIKIEPRLLAREIAKVRYVAPEVLQNEPVTHFSDQYSLAMIIYEILSGGVLFTADKMNNLLEQINDHIPPDIPNCPAGVSQILRKALSKKPSLRFQTSKQFIDELVLYCNSDTTDQPTLQPHESQEKIDKPTVDELSWQKNIEFESIELPQVLSEIEPAATFQEVKTVINQHFQNKKIESKVIKRILWERRSQDIFFLCYLLIFLGCVIVAIILRDPIATMIEDLLNFIP